VKTEIPELNHGEGSWVCTLKDGNVTHYVELFSRRNVELLQARGWSIETIGAYLGRLNSDVRQSSQAKE
jgi:hypothetical protein